MLYLCQSHTNNLLFPIIVLLFQNSVISCTKITMTDHNFQDDISDCDHCAFQSSAFSTLTLEEKFQQTFLQNMWQQLVFKKLCTIILWKVKMQTAVYAIWLTSSRQKSSLPSFVQLVFFRHSLAFDTCLNTFLTRRSQWKVNEFGQGLMEAYM